MYLRDAGPINRASQQTFLKQRTRKQNLRDIRNYRCHKENMTTWTS